MLRVLRRIAGRLRSRLRDYRAAAAIAAELRGMSDRDLADIALSRGDIDCVANGTYADPREAIFATRRAASARRAAAATKRTTASGRRVAA